MKRMFSKSSLHPATDECWSPCSRIFEKQNRKEYRKLEYLGLWSAYRISQVPDWNQQDLGIFFR